MHSPLEEYLNEVTERLGPLPVARRNEELREMRQHLLNAVIVNQEFGQSETEAVGNAVEQFGMPQETADSLVGAWRREDLLKKRDFWGATGCTLGLLFLHYQVNQFAAFHTNFSRFLWSIGLYGYLIVVPLQLCLTILPGWIAGTFFRKRAVQGTVLAILVCDGIETIRLILEHQTYMPSMFVFASIYSLIPALSAWGVVRWREKAVKKAEASCLIRRA